jgi:hypothetical protein
MVTRPILYLRVLMTGAVLGASGCPPAVVTPPAHVPLSLVVEVTRESMLKQDEIIGNSERFVRDRVHSYQVFVPRAPGMLTCSVVADDPAVTLSVDAVATAPPSDSSVGPGCQTPPGVSREPRVVSCATDDDIKFLVRVSLTGHARPAPYRLTCEVHPAARSASVPRPTPETEAETKVPDPPRPPAVRPKKSFKAQVLRSQKKRGVWEVTLDTCGLAPMNATGRLGKLGVITVLSLVPCVVRLNDAATPPASSAEVQVIVDSGKPK